MNNFDLIKILYDTFVGLYHLPWLSIIFIFTIIVSFVLMIGMIAMQWWDSNHDDDWP